MVKGDHLRLQSKGVREREVQVRRVGVRHPIVSVTHINHIAEVAVREHAPLRRTGRPRRIQKRVRILPLDRSVAPGRLGELASTITAKSRRSTAAARAPRGSSQAARGPRKSPLPPRSCPRPTRTARGTVRVDRYLHPPDRCDRKIGVRPFRTRLGQNAHPLASLDPQIEQAARDLADDLADLAERDVLPNAITLDRDRWALRILLGRPRKQISDRTRSRR